MSAGDTGADGLASLVAAALSEARGVVTDLDSIVIPALPPMRRSYPKYIVDRLLRDEIFDDALLRDIDNLGGEIHRLVADGTHVGWLADDHHVRGGYQIVVQDGDTARLAAALCRMEDLQRAITRALDAARAIRAMDKLLDC